MGLLPKLGRSPRETIVAPPRVLTPSEVRAVLGHLKGTSWLMASLMYGTGLRLMECCRLRVKDVDFERGEVVVRDGKGRKDRVTMLPDSLKEALRAHLVRVKEQHAHDLTVGRVPWCCRARSSGSILRRPENGDGSGCFQRCVSMPTGRPGNSSAITVTSPSSSAT